MCSYYPYSVNLPAHHPKPIPYPLYPFLLPRFFILLLIFSPTPPKFTLYYFPPLLGLCHFQPPFYNITRSFINKTEFFVHYEHKKT